MPLNAFCEIFGFYSFICNVSLYLCTVHEVRRVLASNDEHLFDITQRVEMVSNFYLAFRCFQISDTTEFVPGWDSNSHPSDLWANT